MKHNSVWGKLLLLALSFVLAFSTLVSCTKDDIAALDKENDEIKTELGTTEENLAKLQTLVNEIKATADAAATKAALKDATDALAEVKATADAAVTAAKLAEVKEALEGALATADAAVKAELEAAIAAVKLTADAAVTEAQLAAAKATLEAAIAGKADKADLDEAIATLESLEEATEALEAALKGEIAAAVQAIETKLATYATAESVAALKTELEGKITALETKITADIAKINTELVALKAKDAEFAGLVESLQAQIENLHKDGSFADFVEATKVLNGDVRVVVENGKVVKIVAEGETEWNTAAEYSIKVFNDITVESKYYVEADYNKFLEKQGDLAFFLGRAISTQAIVDYFADLYAYIDAMPDLNQTLAKLLAEKTKVTTKADDLAAIEEVVTLINNNKAELTEANATAYDAVKKAHQNLLAAVEAATASENAIAAIGKVVFKAESKYLIDEAAAQIKTLKETYFLNEAYTKYYTDDVTTIVENYETLTVASARYEQLVLADANKITVIEEALNYNTVRPLWSDKADLDANMAAFATWCKTYEIDEKADKETIAIIYPTVEGVDPINSLKLAVLYADAMNGIFTNTKFAENIVGVEALNAVVIELMAKSELVLYTDYEEAFGYYANYEALDAAIKFVKLYDADADNNFEEMVAAIAEDFGRYLDRMQTLDNANKALDALYDANVTYLKKVGFNDWDAIELFGKQIADIIEEAEVSVGDANYVAFGIDEKDPFALHEALVTEYRQLTAKVREIYETVVELLDNSNAIALTFGNKIDGFLAELTKIMALGVTDVNLVLPGKTEADNANLADLMDKLETVIAAFVEKAEAAELAAKDVAAAIATLTGYKTNDLKDYEEIAAVKALLDAWVEEYLAADVADAKGDVAQAIKNVAKVNVYLATEAETYYVFVSETDYTACVTTMAAAQAHYDAAKTAWATVKAELDRLAALNWNIHDKAAFEAADAAYVKFVADYYAGKLGVTVTTGENGALVVKGGIFGEMDVYAVFAAQRDKCYAMAETAIGDAKEIKDLINALASAITSGNYADQLDKIDAINEKLEAYKKYCGEICNDCIPTTLLITLYEKEAIAKLYEYAEGIKANVNDATDSEIDKTVSLFTGVILAADDGQRDFATIKTTIDSTLESAKSKIDAKAPCAVGKDHVDENADHNCDKCDKPVSECNDAADDGDHKCDVCGKADITSCKDADTDEKCDDCGADMPHYE